MSLDKDIVLKKLISYLLNQFSPFFQFRNAWFSFSEKLHNNFAHFVKHFNRCYHTVFCWLSYHPSLSDFGHIEVHVKVWVHDIEPAFVPQGSFDFAGMNLDITFISDKNHNR